MMEMAFLLTFILLGCCETVHSTFPKVWLSEYGYTFHKSLDLVEQVTVPASVFQSQSKDYFKYNDFIWKFDNNYVAKGNTTNVGFTCEADQPIFWSISQELHQHHKITAPSWNIITLPIRSSTISPDNVTEIVTFKSLIYIDSATIQANDYSDIYTKRFKKANDSPTWTFTCHKSSNKDKSNSVNIAFRVGNPDTDYIQQKQLDKKMKPEQKIIIAITKQIDINSEMDSEMQNMTSLYLDNATFRIPNYAANRKHIVIGWNYVLNLTSHLQDNGPPPRTNLMEYGEKDDIIHEGDHIQIFCFSLQKFYVFGIYVQIHWENGTTTKLQDVKTERRGIKVFLKSDAIKRFPMFAKGVISDLVQEDMLFYLSQSFEAKPEMKSADCYMPLWNSGGEWDKVTRELNILPNM